MTILTNHSALLNNSIALHIVGLRRWLQMCFPVPKLLLPLQALKIAVATSKVKCMLSKMNYFKKHEVKEQSKQRALKLKVDRGE